MLYFWYRILILLILRNFTAPIPIDAKFSRTFRVRLFDCEGLRVMTASRYTVYMDLIRWEALLRSKLYEVVFRGGLAPTLGSQKIIYRRPLKIFSRFKVTLELAGWDSKWVYHIHTFENKDRIAAIGITRALIWKRDVPVSMGEILQKAGENRTERAPASWIIELFENDKAILQAQE